MSHLRIGTTFISAAILIACGGPGGSKEDTAVTQALPSPPAAAPANQAPASRSDPARILNAWPNPDIELLKDYSATGRKHLLRVHMDIELPTISTDLENAVSAGNGAEVLGLIANQTTGGNAAGWGTLKAALNCQELDAGRACTPLGAAKPLSGSWPNPDIILMKDYEATQSTPTYLLRVHMNLRLNDTGDGRFGRIAAALNVPTNANRKKVLKELSDDNAIEENDDDQKLGWRTLKSALGCANRDLTITNC